MDRYFWLGYAANTSTGGSSYTFMGIGEPFSWRHHGVPPVMGTWHLAGVWLGTDATSNPQLPVVVAPGSAVHGLGHTTTNFRRWHLRTRQQVAGGSSASVWAMNCVAEDASRPPSVQGFTQGALYATKGFWAAKHMGAGDRGKHHRV
jgi:hypothetical protein